MQRLHDIVNLQYSMDQVPIVNSESAESKYEKVLKLVQDSGLVQGKEAEELLKDGWGNRYKIHVSQDKEISFKSKKYHEVKGIVDPEDKNTP